jgi:hypothetical protein
MMKKVAQLIILIGISINSYSQIDFFNCINSINWHGTESELINRFPNNVIKVSHNEWKSENSSSDYSMTNINFGQFIIKDAAIRVNKTNRKLFRINFIVFDEITDVSLCHTASKLLTDSLGTPVSKTDEEGLSSFYKIEWLCKDCLVRSTQIVNSKNKYSLVVSVEPIDSYYVDCNNVTIEINENKIPTPLIETFILDNEESIFIRMKGGIISKKEKTKKMNTPKGEVIVFDGGMFCYRKEDNDVVYIRERFVACYPIVSISD